VLTWDLGQLKQCLGTCGTAASVSCNWMASTRTDLASRSEGHSLHGVALVRLWCARYCARSGHGCGPSRCTLDTLVRLGLNESTLKKKTRGLITCQACLLARAGPVFPFPLIFQIFNICQIQNIQKPDLAIAQNSTNLAY
jgi:hypothetical protein